MPTDEQRREVAVRLRELHLGGGSKDLIERTLSDAIGAWRKSGMSWDFITERLADLIEPSCDRDALLALADEMDKDVRLQRERQKSGKRWFIDGLDVREYARRIREALGVES